MKNNKKYLSAALAAIITLGSITAAAEAFGTGKGDVLSLQNALSGSGVISREQDINEDGKVNIFDLSLLKSRQHNESGEVQEMTIPVSSQTVKFMGRHIENDN